MSDNMEKQGNDAAVVILGNLGTLMAIAMFLAPLKTFRRIVANKNTEDFSSFPYICMLLNCSIWVFYCLPGITPNRTSPLITNVIGCIVEIVYLSLFLTFAQGAVKQYTVKMVGAVAGFLVCLVLGVMNLVVAEARSGVVGGFAIVFTILMYGSPLSVMGLVIRTRSVEFMPLLISANGFACSATWAVYGLYVSDINVIVPNILGSLLGVAQLALYFYIKLSETNAHVGQRLELYHEVVNMDGEDHDGPVMGGADTGKKPSQTSTAPEAKRRASLVS